MKPRAVSAATAGLLAGLVGACAQQGQPPGGPDDRRPPVVVSTEPDTFALVEEDFRGPVRFRFDERISERASEGTLDDAVIVSPRTGDVRVRPGRKELTVELDGGFRRGLVYRITLLAAVSDLFNNQIRDPFEIVFSTGGELNESAVAGLAWNRVDGTGVDALEVLAISDEDSTVHVARTDSGGIYAFRYLPPGRYRVVAYNDRNRNQEVDVMEVQGDRSVLLPGADTVFVDVGVLQPDTTPARLTSVQILDSATLVLEFDDYVDPTVPVDNVDVTLELQVDTTEGADVDTAAAAVDTVQPGPPPAVARLMHEHEYTSWVEQVRDSFARLDSLDVMAAMEAARLRQEATAEAQADTTAEAEPDSAAGTEEADTTAVTEEGDTATAPEPEPELELPTSRMAPPPLPLAGGGRLPTARPRSPEGVEQPTGPDGRPLPARRIVAILDGFLEVNVGYRLSAESVVNLAEVPQGGGESAVVRAPPPTPDSTAADSAAVADSLAADSLTADTLAADSLAGPDTLAVPDSLVPPDTTGPDTTGSLDRRRRIVLPFSYLRGLLR